MGPLLKDLANIEKLDKAESEKKQAATSEPPVEKTKVQPTNDPNATI